MKIGTCCYFTKNNTFNSNITEFIYFRKNKSTRVTSKALATSSDISTKLSKNKSLEQFERTSAASPSILVNSVDPPNLHRR